MGHKVHFTQQLPFPLQGIDSDDGGEFINAELLRYCADHKITFTRSRPYRKNDSCFVEPEKLLHRPQDRELSPLRL